MTRITIKEYFATAGSRLTDRDARIIGPVLAELSQARDVDASAVVEAARSANCPLHSYFEWDDKAAADKYRVGQAEEMINTVRVRFASDDDGHERTTRAYRIASVKVDPAPLPHTKRENLPREYQEFDSDELMGDALQELQQWRIKYRPYAEMLGEYKDVATVILNQISEFLEEFKGAEFHGKPLEAIADLRLWAERHGKMAGPAGQFAEQFKYMMEAIAEAERAFDPDAGLESALARENRKLRERIAELEGGGDDVIVEIRKRFSVTGGEARLLKMLSERVIVTREAAIEALHNKSEQINVRVVDTHIKRLRQKVHQFGISIETLYGDGYSMDEMSRKRVRSSALEAA